MTYAHGDSIHRRRPYAEKNAIIGRTSAELETPFGFLIRFGCQGLEMIRMRPAAVDSTSDQQNDRTGVKAAKPVLTSVGNQHRERHSREYFVHCEMWGPVHPRLNYAVGKQVDVTGAQLERRGEEAVSPHPTIGK